MKVAVPVRDDTLTFFGNAGHTPYFAVYTVKGGGMFKSFEFDALRANPRTDLDHSHDDEGHHCHHDHNDEAHVKEHLKMGDTLQDCNFIVVKKACKNTAKAMEAQGVSIKKYSGDATDALAILRGVAAQLS